MKNIKPIKRLIEYLLIVFILYLMSSYNEALFYYSAEVFGICISASIFIIYWNSGEFIKNNYLTIFGVAYFFIGILDFLHMMGYIEINVFKDYEYYTNQLWIATRYLESITLFIAFILINYKRQIDKRIFFAVYTFITFCIILSIFYFRNFPICYIEGYGETLFKVTSEYIIASILIAALIAIRINKVHLNSSVYIYISYSILFTLISEISFAVNYGNDTLLVVFGQLFKVISFILIYKAIVEKGINEPYKIVFNELNEKKNELDKQNAELKQLSIRDELTGLYNRRYIMDFIEKDIARYERYREQFIIAIFDIDNFKSINDNYGHIVGDIVLKELSSIMLENIRQTDIIGRFGGEEFLILMPETNLKNGFSALDKLRRTIENHKFVNNLNITISCGMVEYIGLELNETIDSADMKMYEAKRAGKNRIVY